MSDRASSAAFIALPKAARKLLAAIETAIGDGDCAEVSYVSFMHDYRLSRPTISAGLKAAVALGFVDVEPGPRLIGRYKISDRWRSIDAAQATALARQARQIMPCRRFDKRPAPVEPQPAPETHVETVPFMEQRRPSMPTLRWLASA